MEIEMATAINPILSGFYPDPSICAVGKDFYLVNSTFAYFPAVPIFHSTDLAHWHQIGNVLDRSSQVRLEGCRHSQGIYAPTIRYHEGVFYVITTNVSGGGSFIITAQDPAGPWSEPYFLGEGASGIDPSLFFDSDGTCYYVGTRPNPSGVRYNGDWEIWAQELDIKSMRLTGESYMLWKGAMNGAIWPEGPHLYKKDDYFYLLIAEGGTSIHHSVMVARSHSVYGPYEGNPANPILTHRHLGRQYPVINVGHGDMTVDVNGNWYMVMLASRPCEGHTSMGRETFLAKVVWEDDWPVVNPGVGRLEERIELPDFEGLAEGMEPLESGEAEESVRLSETGKRAENLLIAGDMRSKSAVYDFRQEELGPEFMMLRNPPENSFYCLKEGRLLLYLRPEMMREKTNPSYLCIRQRQQDYALETVMDFEPRTASECAGLAIVQSNDYHIRFEKFLQNGSSRIRVVLCRDGQEKIIASCDIPSGSIELKIVNRRQMADFYYGAEGKTETVAQGVDMCFLSTETAGGFTGCTMGMYASANGTESGNFAAFEGMTVK